MSAPPIIPPPIGAYIQNGGVWNPQNSADPAASGGPVFTPPAVGLYTFNSSLNQWVPYSGLGGAGGIQVAATQALAQTANIAPTLLYAVPVGKGGFYAAVAYTVVTIAAQTSGTLPNGIVLWTDQDTGVSVNGALGATAGTNTVGITNVFGGTQNIKYFRVKEGTNINWQTTGYASVGSPSLAYNAYAKLYYIGP